MSLNPDLILLLALSLLGSDSFRQREWAHCTLERSLPASVPYLQAGRKSADVETSVRCTTILRGWYRRTAGEKVQRMRPRRYPVFPWIDSLPHDHPDRTSIIYYYLEVSRQAGFQSGPPDWPQYREATRFYMRDLLSEPRTADGAQGVLDSMVQGDLDWYAQNGDNYTPPLTAPK